MLPVQTQPRGIYVLTQCVFRHLLPSLTCSELHGSNEIGLVVIGFIVGGIECLVTLCLELQSRRSGLLHLNRLHLRNPIRRLHVVGIMKLRGVSLHQGELFLGLVSDAITRARSSDDHRGRA